MFVYMIKVFIL